MKARFDEDVVKIVKIATMAMKENIKISLVDKTLASFERIASNFESFTRGEMLAYSFADYRELFMIGRESTFYCLILRSGYSYPSLQQPTH